MPVEGDAVPIHGRMDPESHVPSALEVDGRLREVDAYRPRMDLAIAALWVKRYRSYWEVVLDDGTQLLVYRDLEQGGWFRVRGEIPEYVDVQ